MIIYWYEMYFWWTEGQLHVLKWLYIHLVYETFSKKRTLIELVCKA